MEKLEKIVAKYWILLILSLSIPAIWALLVPGFYGASDEVHIGWLHQMDKTLKLGQFPPRFVPDLSFGFGYPLFNFVFPLPFYIAEIFHLLGLNLVDSIKAVFLISVPLSGIAMFLLLREFTNKSLSLLGSMFYIYAPYRAVDLYIRGAIGEILSFVFLPLIILSIFKIIISQGIKLRWIGIGGLSIGALVLTHNITTYMFLPFAFLLGLLLILSSKNKIASLSKLLTTFLLGLLISIYFWLPAILDSGLMKYDTVFDFKDHFPTIKQLIIPYWGYGASVPGPYDGLSFNIGILNLILLGVAGITAVIKWKTLSQIRKTIFIWSGITFLTAFFLMNHRSTIVWENTPLLPFFQFPWRFLILTTFLIPIFVIFLDKYVKNIWIILGCLLLLIGINFHEFRPQDFLGRTDEYFLNKYIPIPKASSEYLKTQEEYLRLPKTTRDKPKFNGGFTNGNGYRVLDSKKINDLNQGIKIETIYGLEDDITVNYFRYYFPGWRATLDGKPITIQPGFPFGHMTVKVPEGVHWVFFSFSETPLKFFLDNLSLGAILVTLILIWKFKLSTKN